MKKKSNRTIHESGSPVDINAGELEFSKPPRGGHRPGSGRPKKEDKKITVQLVLSPDNAEFLQAMGREKNEYVDKLLDFTRSQ